MKAYVVSDDEESVVVFDERSVSARRRGGNIIGCEFEGVESCARAPEFDQYAPGPVPASALLDAGWWVSDGKWRANFRFPGGNGLAKWNVGDDSVWVDADDVDAWHAVQLMGPK